MFLSLCSHRVELMIDGDVWSVLFRCKNTILSRFCQCFEVGFCSVVFWFVQKKELLRYFLSSEGAILIVKEGSTDYLSFTVMSFSISAVSIFSSRSNQPKPRKRSLSVSLPQCFFSSLPESVPFSLRACQIFPATSPALIVSIVYFFEF